MYLTVCPPRSPGSISSHGGVFQGVFFLADHTLPTRTEPTWQKMAQFPLNVGIGGGIGRSTTMKRNNGLFKQIYPDGYSVSQRFGWSISLWKISVICDFSIISLKVPLL